MVDILKKIREFEYTERVRMNRLYEYYIGKHAILNAKKPDGKPNNRIVTNYAKIIVNSTTGYFLGVPVSYDSDIPALNEKICDIIQYNDDASHNIQLGKDLSIFGRAAEVLYLDPDGAARYGKINPMNLYAHYTSDIERKIDYAIRWYDVRDDRDVLIRYIELYTDRDVTYYMSTGGGLLQTEQKEHFFGQVPVNVYQNNADMIGDYEDALSLMDAYNVMQSESVNDFQKFADALLVVKNAIVDDKTVSDIRDKNVLELLDDGEASWLVKQVNDAYVENIKNRLDRDIYAATSTVNMSDDNFANNASGVAIKYKLMRMENRISGTERYFKKGLQRRFEMICNLLNMKGGNFDYRDIRITFIRNIPVNMQETAAAAQQFHGIVSDETLLSQIPFIENAKEELQRKQKESDYNVFANEEMGGVNEQFRKGILGEQN